MTNPEFALAEQFALYTRKHCFVTGKAGTGKTTLLKSVVSRTQKNVAVVAPTGVAAINAGGVTLHSMFGLPLTCFVPNDDFVNLNLATNRHQLLHEHLRLRKEKLQVLRELDLLILDEISMVRCDVLDAIDLILRTVRGSRRPFGDVQVLLIGDVHQLSPVAKEAEWNILRNYYRSPYFFDSLVWPRLDAARIELQTVYRQSDARFLSLLENVRNRRLGEDDYRKLQERYDPGFKAGEPGYVLLTTHNRNADHVNASELAALPGRAYSFTAQIDGEFPQHLFPCERVLHLKVGAQVMFTRNDSEGGAYYNGKLAVVKQIGDTGIIVTFRDSGKDYLLHHETWQNIGYSLNKATGKVLKEELGSFSHYPLRLAWAITIHKSQGLTFDKVIIDAGRSFAPGQVYVALSRCRSLEGIVLRSLITADVLHRASRICQFSASHHGTRWLQDVLVGEKSRYANDLLSRLFTFGPLSAHLEEWLESIVDSEVPDKQAAIALHGRMCAHMAEIDAMAEKFQGELQHLLKGEDFALLRERCAKAIRYFTAQIATQLIEPLREHAEALAHNRRIKGYVQGMLRIEESCWRKIERLYDARFRDERLYDGEIVHARYEEADGAFRQDKVPAGVTIDASDS